MLKFKKIWETSKEIAYEYRPEGGKDSGVVIADKKSGECRLGQYAVNDSTHNYACHMAARIRKFVLAKKFEENGMVAWY